MQEASHSQAMVLLGDLSHPDICWRCNRAGHKESLRCLESVQQRIIKELQHLSSEERPRELQVFILEKKGLRSVLLMSINTWWERAILSGAMTRQEAMGSDWNMKFHLNMEKHCNSMKVIKQTATNCPETLWSLHPCRYLKANWAQSWTTYFSWWCSDQVYWTRYLRRPIQFELFCESVAWFLSSTAMIVKSSLQKMGELELVILLCIYTA